MRTRPVVIVDRMMFTEVATVVTDRSKAYELYGPDPRWRASFLGRLDSHQQHLISLFRIPAELGFPRVAAFFML
jgi:hypothetical protein